MSEKTSRRLDIEALTFRDEADMRQSIIMYLPRSA